MWQAGFLPAVLYGCETFLAKSINNYSVIYNTSLKCLPGVKSSTPTTPNDIVLAELGVQPVQSIVEERQCKFFTSLFNRSDWQGSYLGAGLGNISTPRQSRDISTHDF